MRKGLVFKKGIIFALAAAVVTSPAPVMGVSGWGVMNAKAEETTTEKIPKYLLMGSTRLIDNGELQDDGVSGNDDTIYQGTNWYYDITRNQLVLENAYISGNITIQNGDLSIMLSGTNTMRSDMVIQSILTESGIVPTLEINGNNQNESLSCGKISADDLGSNNNNIKIIGATLETSQIECSGSLTIENSHVVANEEDHSNVISGDKINIVDSYVEAKATTERYEGEVIRSNQQINVSGSQIVVSRALACQEPVLSDCDFSNSVITKQWNDIETGDDVTKTYVYGKAALKEDLTIASGESIEFESSASITNLDKLIVEDGATILVDGAEHKHNTNGDITYIWQDDKEHTKGVACKDCPIGYVTKETEAHNYNSQGFCTDCDAYQPAVLTTDKYDINEDGTKDAVYEISNAGQLYWFAGLVNGTLSGVAQNKSANAVLTADIVVNANVLKSDGTLNEGTFKEWTPIATSASPYTGIFDGQNHTISGLYFNQENSYDVGLFGRNNGKIANAGILDSYFYGTSKVGGVCGNNYTGTISNCYNTGSVSGLGNLGGVNGYNDGGTITNSYNAGSVSGTERYVGGVSGYNDGGTITNCYNVGSVGGSGYVGGVNGWNKGIITNCYNTGSVSGTGVNVGGVIGRNESNASITNCYYDSTIYTGNAIGANDGTTEKVEGKTTEQFKTGEVAYLLQNGQSAEIWGQTIGTDTYPVLHGPKVYKSITYMGCNDSSEIASVSYSNEKKDVFGKHNFEDGICRYCGEKLAATVTKGDETISCVSLPEAISYAENMPDSVVTVMEDTNTALDINNPDSDFTIDINGHKTDDIDVKNGKITIIDSKTGGDVKGHLDIKKDSTVTIGNVKISGTIHTMGQLILNGGDINKIILADETIKLYFNNSDIKINDGIYLYGIYGEKIIINAEPHNVIPIVLDGIGVQQGAAYAVAGDGIALKSDWFNASSDDSIIDLSTSIEDNKLRIGALLNDKVYAELDENKNIIYSGSELKPSVKVYYNWDNMFSVQLKEGSDYNVTYSDNINAGTATAIVTGIGAYSGTKNVTFTIEPKKISSPTFDGLKPEYTYTGQKVEPEFALMDGETVIPSSEYEVSYSDNTEVGTATITITDATGGNYDINCKAEFDIVKADPVISELPVADPISYDPHKTLNEASISGGAVIGVSGENITGTWSWADDSTVPVVDVTDYDVVFTPDDQKHYNSIRGTIQVNVLKANVNIADLPTASAITYGDSLAKSVLYGGTAYFDGINKVEIFGTFAWKDDSLKPFVSDSDKTLYTVVFTPADSVNYNTAEIEITVNVSKAAMPNLLLSVDNTHKTVGSIALPGDWVWLAADTATAIKAGGSVVATAVYAGDDKENYDSTELKVTIYRAPCSDGKTVKYTLKGEKAPTCTKAGTGHTECSVCGDVMSTGVCVKELGHK